jgi:hypothetical protein
VLFLTNQYRTILPYPHPTSHNILITPKEINLNGTIALREVEEFKLNGKQYIRISPLQALKLRVTAYKKAPVEAAAVQLIREDKDNNKKDKAKEEAKEEALEAEFAAIKAILN